jgi:hypothetical protein
MTDEVKQETTLRRRQTDPVWLQDHFMFTGHDENTESASGTFVKFKGRIYLCTCRHVFEEKDNTETVPGAQHPTLALQLDKGALNLSYFTTRGLQAAMKVATGREMDIAIAPMTEGYWVLMQQKKNKVAIDLDAWCAPDWKKVKYCVAVGYPNEHKTHVVVDGSNKVGVPFFEVVAELATNIHAESKYVTLSSKLPEPHGLFFSGMSGGAIYAVEGELGNNVEEDAILPVGIIFSGFPTSGRRVLQRDPGEAFLTPNDILIRGLLLTPQIFREWLADAGIA